MFDSALGGSAYADALAAQRVKLDQPDATPSARLLEALTQSGLSFHDYSLAQSAKHADTLRAQALPTDLAAAYEQAAVKSAQEQLRLEESDTVDFATYVARYHDALKAPRK
ncbi:glutamate--cysteine ligase [compost metagenome]